MKIFIKVGDMYIKACKIIAVYYKTERYGEYVVIVETHGKVFRYQIPYTLNGERAVIQHIKKLIEEIEAIVRGKEIERSVQIVDIVPNSS